MDVVKYNKWMKGIRGSSPSATARAGLRRGEGGTRSRETLPTQMNSASAGRDMLVLKVYKRNSGWHTVYGCQSQISARSEGGDVGRNLSESYKPCIIW